MTIKELLTTVTNWNLARESGDRISREIREVRNKYIGKAAVETMPNGNCVSCVIVSIDWVQEYGISGGWDVGVIYTDTMLKGQMSHTSDTVLSFGSK